MATRPKLCPPDAAEGFLLDRSSLVLEEADRTSQMMDLSDFSLNLTSYAKTRYRLTPGSSFRLAQSDIGDSDGYVSFIAFNVTYPLGTTTVNKYLNWTYNGKTNPLGEIMILSGKRIDSEVMETVGWDLSYSAGIVIENPSDTLTADIEILVAR